MPQNRSSIIIFLYGCATVTLLDADPFNSILNGNDYFCLKPKLGKLFGWRKYFYIKGSRKGGAEFC